MGIRWSVKMSRSPSPFLRDSDVPPGRVILEPIIDAGGAKVNGADLVMMNVGEDPVSFLMGDSFDLETPTGETVSVQIPEGSSFGLTVTVPGKGLPLIFGAAEPRGNLILRLIPEFPGNMTEEQAEMLRVYAVSRGIGNAGGFDLVQEADKA
jgi:DnaJ-class molecular chaperone